MKQLFLNRENALGGDDRRMTRGVGQASRLSPSSRRLLTVWCELIQDSSFNNHGGSEFRKIGDRRGACPTVANWIIQWLLVVLACSVSAQDADKIPQLAPPYPELPPTFWEQHGNAIIMGGIVLVLLVAVGLWLGLRKKPVTVVPPEVWARNELKALQALPADGTVLSKVSQALRRYFIAAFGLPPGEYTTAEFCRVVGGNEEIGVELSSSVAAFLRNCDENKFSPASAAPLSAVARALELVERGEALRQPASVEKT